jgi:hypothetical protein
MKRRQPLEVGQPVHWDYPHDDIPTGSGRYVVAKSYPPTSGSASYVHVAKELGGEEYPALPEELTVLPN